MATRRNGVYSYRKTKKLLKKKGHAMKSSKRRKYVTRGGKSSSESALVDFYRGKANPPTLASLARGIKAKWVKIRKVKNGIRVTIKK